MSLTVNNGGVLHKLNAISTNNGGVLKNLSSVLTNDNGVLHEIFAFSSPTNIRWRANVSSVDQYAKINSVSDDGLTLSFTADSHKYGNTDDSEDTLSITSQPFSFGGGVIGITITQLSNWRLRYGLCKLSAYKQTGTTYAIADYVFTHIGLTEDPQTCNSFMNMKLDEGKYYLCLQACSSYSPHFSTNPSTASIQVDATISYPSSYKDSSHLQ